MLLVATRWQHSIIQQGLFLCDPGRVFHQDLRNGDSQCLRSGFQGDLIRT